MRVLITNMTLKSRSGTETMTRDLALGLLAAGDQPVVYSPALGDIAHEIAGAGIEVVDHLDRLTAPPDIIHGHHYVETYQAMARFPETRAIFVIHDATAWHDAPPFAPQLLRYVAVDLNCRARLAERYLIRSRIDVICNTFDPARFPRRAGLAKEPRRALVFSDYATHSTFLRPIEEACAALKIPVDVIGSRAGRSHPNPGEILHDYDLVFAIARCAIEAMASGAAVILCGAAGLGPLVTRNNVEELRPWNFGRRLLVNPHDPKLIGAEIKKYNAADALSVCDYIRVHAPVRAMIAQYQALYREVMAEPLPPRVDYSRMPSARQRRMRSGSRWRGIPAFQENASRILPPEISRRPVAGADEMSAGCIGAVLHRVKLKNASVDALSSDPPYAVFFSYHWLSMEGKTVVAEGARSRIDPVSIPGGERLYRAAVQPPPATGRHRLRVTLVQERVMWFDELKPPVMAEPRSKSHPVDQATPRLARSSATKA